MEGYEPFVLDGAKKLIQKSRPALYLEITPSLYQQNGRSAYEIFDYLYENNYKVFKDGEKGLQKIDEIEHQLLEEYQFNILAIPQRKI